LHFRSDGSRWIYVFYLVLLVWAPIPLGSNRPWSWGVLEIWVLLLSLVWLAGHMRARYAVGPVFQNARPMLLCVAAWLGYVWLQLLPMPVEILDWISPEAARWHRAAAAPVELGFAPLTLDRHATLEGACKSTAYVVFFMLSLVLLNSRDRIRFASYALILSGVLQALYGAFVALQGAAGVASGTFVNRNHFAAYLVMCLSVGIGVLIASLSGSRSATWGQFFRSLVKWMISPRMGLRLLLVTMVIALVLTHSRMGNMAFFISLFATGIIGLVLSKRATRSMVVLLVSLIAIDVFIVGAYFGTERVVERIGQTTAATEDRDEVAGYAVNMWKDYPALGAGLGSFPVVFPSYSGPGTMASYTHAHNDYLEFGAEVGIVGLAILGLMVLMSFAAALRAQHLRTDPVMRGLSFAAMMGIMAMMIHSTVDFNLQIPANALTFMQLLAFAWISRYYSDAEDRPASGT
jgi:O-antigen ligase